jgi:NitT/TauT family transport system substrate-binding protein
MGRRVRPAYSTGDETYFAGRAAYQSMAYRLLTYSPAGSPGPLEVERRNMKRILGIFCAAIALNFAHAASAQTDLKFALDWKFEGPSAPYFVAIDKGYYKAEGLNVTVDTGPGSVAGIGRVAAGAYPMGFFDINSLARFRNENPEKDVKGVLMVYDQPPFAIITLAKSGITKPTDLQGRILGAPAPDGAFAQWKAFVQENKIDASKVKIENVGFPVREPMLAKGDVDAITGFSFSSYFNLMQAGVAPKDIKVMLMSDYGLVLYGNAVMVNPDFAKANPKIVAGFVRATIKGMQDTVKDPAAALKSVMKRNETGDEKIELERLKMALDQNVMTPWVKANGFGGIDAVRMAKSIDQIGVTYEFKAKPTAADMFTSEYLPPAAERKL